jgi:RimJ/RimL family protein N-acetyltransferase
MGAVPTDLLATIAGEVVTIRPIRITDAEMEAAFIRRLSPESKHYRFLGGVKELAPGEVSRLCEVDGKHSMAFVATIRHDGRETEIGVSRYAPNSRSDVREIAVTVADAWQHKGLGTMLMRQLIESAQSNGVRHLYSTALSDNAAMRALAEELGMTAKRDPNDLQQTIYSLAL